VNDVTTTRRVGMVNFKRDFQKYDISGSQSGEYEDDSHLGYTDV
jgi:hypothetical protein